MKKNLITKVLAVSLSFAMACSATVTKPITASAAAGGPYVSAWTTFKTLKVKQTYWLKLKNNTIDWKVKRVTTSDKTTVMVYNKTTERVKLKGKKVGRATVHMYLETSKRKTNNTKKVACRVNVKAAETPAVETEKTVGTQAELDAALANKALTKITVKTAEDVDLKLSGDHKDVDLEVDAAKADIENSATFKSITIKAIKENTWIEKAIGNLLTILAPKAHVVVEKGFSVKGITINALNADVNLEVNGKVENVSIAQKAKVTIGGTPEANIPVVVESSAADTELTSSAPIELEAKVAAAVTLKPGAENSSVKISAATGTVKVANNTGRMISVTNTVTGKVEQVAAGASSDFTPNGSTPSTPGGTPSIPNIPSIPGSSTTLLPATSFVTDGAIRTVSPNIQGVNEQNIITSGSISVDYWAAVTTTGAALDYDSLDNVEVQIRAEGEKSKNISIDNFALGNIIETIISNDGKMKTSIGRRTIDIAGFYYNEKVTVTAYFRVKATSITAASSSYTSKPETVWAYKLPTQK